MFFGTGKVSDARNLTGIVFDDFGERREESLDGFYVVRVWANNFTAQQAIITSNAGTGFALVPTILNVFTSATAGQETNFGLTNIQRYQLTNRGTVNVQVSFTAGQSGTVYFVIPPGATYEEPDFIVPIGVTFYVQASLPSQRIEVVGWS